MYSQESKIGVYALLCGDDIVLTFLYINGVIHYSTKNIENVHLLPTLVRKTDLETWILQRSIDTHRTNSRVLAKMLRIKQDNIVDNIIQSHASSLTDNYWIKPVNSDMTYDKLLSKRRDFLSKVALHGEFDFDIYDTKPKPYETPELTLGGSYEKCWCNNVTRKEWFMVKKGEYIESFNELLACALARELGFNHVEYSIYNNDVQYVKCDNFVKMLNYRPLYNYEPMSYYLYGRDDDEDFETNLDVFKNISEGDKDLEVSLVRDYTNMLIFDAIILNFDRHTENYGLFKSIETNKVISLAPLFDHNLSLLKNNIRNINTGDTVIKNLYLPFIREVYKTYDFTFPILNISQIQSCVDTVWKVVFNSENIKQDIPSITKEELIDFIYHKYLLLYQGISGEICDFKLKKIEE